MMRLNPSMLQVVEVQNNLLAKLSSAGLGHVRRRCRENIYLLFQVPTVREEAERTRRETTTL